MRYLNLDPDFQPYGKGIAFEHFTFPGGEPHIKIQEEVPADVEVMVVQRVRSFNDLGTLLLAVDALRRIGVKHIALTLPYFPGARQDRQMVHGEPLTVKVYAQLINGLMLDKVIILDPHSEVTPALLDNGQVVSHVPFALEVLTDLEDFVLVAPDAGALKKVYELAKAADGPAVILSTKKRNVATGALSGFEVMADDLGGQTCVVVDDICDGGGTFLGLAEALKRKNAGKLILIVTHGIFSKGTEALAAQYDRIYCTNSFRKLESEDIIQLELNHQLLNQ